MRIMRGGQNRCTTNTPTHLTEQVFDKRLNRTGVRRTRVRRTGVLYKFLNRTGVRVRSWPAARTHTALSRDFAAAYAAYADFPELPKTSSWLRPKEHTGSSKEFCLTGPHFCGIIKVSGFFCPAHVKKEAAWDVSHTAPLRSAIMLRNSMRASEPK